MLVEQISQEEQFQRAVDRSKLAIFCFASREQVDSEFVTNFNRLSCNKNYSAVGFYLVYADSCTGLMEKYNIGDTPAAIFFMNGKKFHEVERPNVDLFKQILRENQ